MRAADYLPKFDTVEDERLHRKQRLAAAYRLFGRFGFDEGVAGHITVRDPERLDHFWVNPFGMNFSHIRVSDLILVNDKGEVVEGDYGVNTAAFVIHSAIHQARPDVVAAAHSHSVNGKAFSSLGIPLDPITQDSCIFYQDHTVIAEQGGAVVFEVEAGKISVAHGWQHGPEVDKGARWEPADVGPAWPSDRPLEHVPMGGDVQTWLARREELVQLGDLVWPAFAGGARDLEEPRSHFAEALRVGRDRHHFQAGLRHGGPRRAPPPRARGR